VLIFSQFKMVLDLLEDWIAAPGAPSPALLGPSLPPLPSVPGLAAACQRMAVGVSPPGARQTPPSLSPDEGCHNCHDCSIPGCPQTCLFSRR